MLETQQGLPAARSAAEIATLRGALSPHTPAGCDPPGVAAAWGCGLSTAAD